MPSKSTIQKHRCGFKTLNLIQEYHVENCCEIPRLLAKHLFNSLAKRETNGKWEIYVDGPFEAEWYSICATTVKDDVRTSLRDDLDIFYMIDVCYGVRFDMKNKQFCIMATFSDG